MVLDLGEASQQESSVRGTIYPIQSCHRSTVDVDVLPTCAPLTFVIGIAVLLAVSPMTSQQNLVHMN